MCKVRMRLFIMLLSSLVICNCWQVQYGTSWIDQSYNMVKDNSSNLYIVGYTAGHLSGTNQQLGWYDIFIRKVSTSNGNAAYTVQFGTTDNDYSKNIVIDDEFMYIAGYTQGSFIGYSNQGNTDIFISKRYLSNGIQSYTKQYGTSAHDVVYDMTSDSTSLYIAGYTGGVLGLSSFGAADAYVRKLTKSLGVTEWTSQFGTNNQDYAYGISLDSSNTYIYVSGQTWGSFPTFSNNGLGDIFVRKMYTSNGTEIWLKQFGTSGSENHVSLIVIDSYIYLSGYSSGYMNGTSGTLNYNDVIVQKLNSLNGDEIWVQQFGSTTGSDIGETIKSDGTYIYVSGTAGGCCIGSTSFGNKDAFVTRLSMIDGGQLWTQQYGTSDDDISRGMVVETSTNVLYVSGSTVGSLAAANAGDYDAFSKSFTTPTPAPTPAPTAAPYPYDDLITNKTETLDGSNESAFGSAMSMSEANVVAIGSFTNMNTSSNGVVDVYKRNSSSGLWYRTHQLYKENYDFMDQFGNIISIDKSGTRLLVGTDQVDRAYIYYLQENGYLLESVLLPNKTSQFPMLGFGSSVSLTSNIAIVGAQTDNSVFIFKRNSSNNNNWYQDDYFKSQESIQFGSSVDINSGDIIAIGAKTKQHNGTSNSGSVYIYKYDTSEWINENRIDVPIQPSYVNSFGRVVKLSQSGNTLCVTADLFNVFIYGKSNNTWNLIQHINSTEFGDVNIDINDDGTTLVIGSPNIESGRTYVYIRDNENQLFTFSLELDGVITNDPINFGSSVAIGGDGFALVVGSSNYNNGLGGAFMFSNVGPTRSPTASPTEAPSNSPSVSPSNAPSNSPTTSPSIAPSEAPSGAPSELPSSAPSELPSSAPSVLPSSAPSELPSELPSKAPTVPIPSISPSSAPSKTPSTSPSLSPTKAPSVSPTKFPSESPSVTPSESPSEAPTTPFPSATPSQAPSQAPTEPPTPQPTVDPNAVASSSSSSDSVIIIVVVIILVLIGVTLIWYRKRKRKSGRFDFKSSEGELELEEKPKYRKQTAIEEESSDSWYARRQRLKEKIPKIMELREKSDRNLRQKNKQTVNKSSSGKLSGQTYKLNYKVEEQKLDDQITIDDDPDDPPPPSLSRLFTPTEDLNLPTGWKRYFDDEKHLPYYYNDETGESTWVKPQKQH